MVALSGGCGGGPAQSKVKGTVSLNGKPLDTGVIHFYPQSDAGGPSASADIKDGLYQLQTGIGPMKVVINSHQVIGKRKLYDTPDSPVVEDTRDILPARYNMKSELKADLVAGDNEVNFDLQSDKQK
jgi:hypothetical protein